VLLLFDILFVKASHHELLPMAHWVRDDIQPDIQQQVLHFHHDLDEAMQVKFLVNQYQLLVAFLVQMV
jgi:hypothetical protein